MNDTLRTIINRIHQMGGRPLAVGGSVRDELLCIKPKDIDVEVHNMPATLLIGLLSEFGKVDSVGVSFGVIKLWTAEGDFDFSLPRRENKIGQGHKGFQVDVDPTLSIEEAAARRDFTINSMAKDLITGELIDPFGGLDDLFNCILRHTSPAFVEDPLRVLRGMQIAGRFDMDVTPGTAIVCSELLDEFHTLAKERVWAEWEKWALKSIKPSKGLQFLVMTNWISMFPELEALMGCEQDPDWHPEGSVWKHTKHVVNAAVEVCNTSPSLDRLVVMFAALCHDMGKPATTEFTDGHWRSPGHDKAGEEPTRSFMTRIGAPKELIEKVVECVREHMVHIGFTGSERSVRRFIARLKHATVMEVMAVIEADHNGRPPLPVGIPAEAKAMIEVAEMLCGRVFEIKPILMGRHMLEMGFVPGPAMGVVLKEAFEAQLDGVFDSLEGAKTWLVVSKQV